MPAYYYFALQGNAQRFALPALGRGRRSRPARKMLRRRKLLEICAESPASGARFVRQPSPKYLLSYFSLSFQFHSPGRHEYAERLGK